MNKSFIYIMNGLSILILASNPPGLGHYGRDILARSWVRSRLTRFGGGANIFVELAHSGRCRAQIPICLIYVLRCNTPAPAYTSKRVTLASSVHDRCRSLFGCEHSSLEQGGSELT